jgi:hypothetical protein
MGFGVRNMFRFTAWDFFPAELPNIPMGLQRTVEIYYLH